MTTISLQEVVDVVKELSLQEIVELVKELQNENEKLSDALLSIEHVGVDFGYYESAARTMQAIARKALGIRFVP